MYTLKDVRLRFSEPRNTVVSGEKLESLLSSTVHWSERGALEGVALEGVAPGSSFTVGGMDVPGKGWGLYCLMQVFIQKLLD